MKRFSGFTLIEILVALLVFSIIASITSASLYEAFNARERVNLISDKLSELELAMALLEQDTSQIISRSVRGDDLRYYPAFVGKSQYIEFTRSGVLKPKQRERGVSIQRVAYRCEEGKLYRKSWIELDTVSRNRAYEKVIMSNLLTCQFEYFNSALSVLDQWRPQHSIHKKGLKPELLPKAIRIHLKIKKWGALNPVFVIPKAAYANLSTK